MTRNVGKIDRVLRFGIGVILIAYALASGALHLTDPVLQIGAIVVGLVMIGTSAARFCPLYRLFGLRTCSPNA